MHRSSLRRRPSHKGVRRANCHLLSPSPATLSWPSSTSGTRRGVTTPTSQGHFAMLAAPSRRGCRISSTLSRARTPYSFIAPSPRLDTSSYAPHDLWLWKCPLILVLLIRTCNRNQARYFQFRSFVLKFFCPRALCRSDGLDYISKHHDIFKMCTVSS